jgi:uncharacterized membrane protein HdeD (DUF308 family)
MLARRRMHMKVMGILALIWGVFALGYYGLQMLDEAQAEHGWKQFPTALICIALGIGLLVKAKDSAASGKGGN